MMTDAEEEMRLFRTDHYEWVKQSAPRLLHKLRTEPENMRQMRWAMAGPALRAETKRIAALSKAQK